MFVTFVTLLNKNICPFQLVHLMLPQILNFYILIFGVLYLYPPFMAIDIFSLLLMIIVDSYESSYSKLNLRFLIMSNHSLKWFKLNFMSPLNASDLIMAQNFSFHHFMSHVVFYTKNLVLKPPNKMVELKENISIS